MRRCECGSKNLFKDMVRGELVCNECGLVLEDCIMVSDAHYVRFTSSDHNSEMSLSTVNPVNPLKVKSHGERRLEAIYHELKHKQVTQDVRDRAWWLIKKYLRSQGKLPIHSLEDFVDAVACLVCKEQNLPYKAKVSMKTVRDVGKQLTLAGVIVWSRFRWPEDYLNKIVPELGLGPEVKEGAALIANQLNRFSPATRAAAGVMIAMREMGREVSIKAVAKSAGISNSTLSKALKQLQKEDSTSKTVQATGKTRKYQVGNLPECYFLERLMEAVKLAGGMRDENEAVGLEDRFNILRRG